MEQDIFTFALAHMKRGKKVALVTLVEKSAGAPGAAGQMMAVLADGTTKGTIGGGTSEYEVISKAIEAIEKNTKIFTFSFDLSETGMKCGGMISGYGNVLGMEAHLVVFGAGHVAQSLIKHVSLLGFTVTIIDDRPELASKFTNVNYITAKPDNLGEAIDFDSSTYIIIATREHESDYAALMYSLNRPSAYLGMIGSINKVKEAFKAALAAGAAEDRLSQVHAPIGLDVADGTPEEIAISILAELLLVKNKGSLTHKKLFINEFAFMK